MDADRCPSCGASYALVGRVHRCRGVQQKPAEVKRIGRRRSLSPNSRRCAHCRLLQSLGCHKSNKPSLIKRVTNQSLAELVRVLVDPRSASPRHRLSGCAG
jgi:hypothetical protein